MNFEALTQRIGKTSWARHWRILAGLALFVAGAISLARLGLAPEFEPLYPALTEGDGSAVRVALDQGGYRYKLSPSGAVLVERSKIYEARHKLATLGLPRSQAAATSRLGANAAPGPPPADTSPIDGSRRPPIRAEADLSDAQEQRAHATALRQDLQARVERLLDPLVGRGGVKAEIDVEVELGNEESGRESWTPNQREASIRSQQTPGSPSASSPPATPSGSANSSLGSVTNYELDRFVVKSTRKVVKIKRIRAAVLIDYKRTPDRDGKLAAAALSTTDLAKIQTLIQEAIGIDEERGDSMQMTNMAFVDPAPGNTGTDLTPRPPPYWFEPELAIWKWLAALTGALTLAWGAVNLRRDRGAAGANDLGSHGPERNGMYMVRRKLASPVSWARPTRCHARPSWSVRSPALASRITSRGSSRWSMKCRLRKSMARRPCLCEPGRMRSAPLSRYESSR